MYVLYFYLLLGYNYACYCYDFVLVSLHHALHYVVNYANFQRFNSKESLFADGRV